MCIPRSKLIQKLGAIRRKFYGYIGVDPVTRLKVYTHPTKKIGTEQGGWYVPLDMLKKNSICYCIGAGEDISFDLELLGRGCDVYTFDPTPRAIEYVKKIGGVRFFPFGVWSENVTQRFYAPKNPNHVSHSILNLQKTDTYFDAECKTVAELMRMNGHTALDLLKLDIEGAEYAVIASVLSKHLSIRIICVEFDEIHSTPSRAKKQRIQNTARALVQGGYRLIKVDSSNYTFLHLI